MVREKVPERCPHRWCFFCACFEAGLNVGDGLKGFVPEEFRHHLSTAQRETLLALRSILDCCIKGIEERPGTRRRPQKVRME